MRALATAVLLLLAVGCGSPVPPSPSAARTSTGSPAPVASPLSVSSPSAIPAVSSTPTPTLQMGPTPSAGPLAPGSVATIQKHVKQVADPEHPKDKAYQGSEHTGARVLAPLEPGFDVYLLESRTVDGQDWWKVADSQYVGCCAPFGWIPARDPDGDAIAVHGWSDCPDPSKVVTSYDLQHANGFGPAPCFGDAEIIIRGYLECDRPAVDGPLFLSGLNSYDQTGYVCQLDNQMDVYGAIVPHSGDANANEWHQFVDVTGQYFAPESGSCRWEPGNMYAIPVEDPPPDTAAFACQMEFFARSATPLP